MGANGDVAGRRAGGDGVGVAMALGEGVAVGVGPGATDGPGEGDGVLVTVGVADADGVGAGVWLGAALGAGVPAAGVGVALGVGLGVVAAKARIGSVPRTSVSAVTSASAPDLRGIAVPPLKPHPGLVNRRRHPARRQAGCQEEDDWAATMAFLIVKYLHILAAITAVGLNISYGVWIARARSDGGSFTFALKGIKFLDDRIANPAYGLLLLTGIAMVFLAPYRIVTFWIDAAIVLWVALVAVGATQYTPTLRTQIRLAEGGDIRSAEFMRLNRRGQLLGYVLLVMVLAILLLMVFKPSP